MRKELGPTTGKEGFYHVIVEIPAQGNIKYEVDETSGLIKADRFMSTAFCYPCNYGSVPGTLAGDKDPVDALVISSGSLIPGCFLEARPIGYLETHDESGADEKVIFLPSPKSDPAFAHVKTLEDLPKILLERIAHFFEHYKDLEPSKWTKIGVWKDQKAAIELIDTAIENYERNLDSAN